MYFAIFGVSLMANQITKKLEINLIQNAQGLFLKKKKLKI